MAKLLKGATRTKRRMSRRIKPVMGLASSDTLPGIYVFPLIHAKWMAEWSPKRSVTISYSSVCVSFNLIEFWTMVGGRFVCWGTTTKATTLRTDYKRRMIILLFVEQLKQLLLRYFDF